MGIHGGFKLFRVLRWSQDAHTGWACGICRGLYRTEEEAWACLARCTVSATVEFSTLLQNSVVHQCPLCAKRYAHMSDARLCATRCLESLPLPPAIRKKVEDALNHQPTTYAHRSARPLGRGKTGVLANQLLEANWGTSAHHPLSTFEPVFTSPPPLEMAPAPVRQVPPPPAAAPVAKRPVPVAAAPTPARAPVAPPQAMGRNPAPSDPSPAMEALPPPAEPMLEAVETPAAPITPPEPLGPKEPLDPKMCRYPNQKPFKRMDARYECTVCHSKYFTKADVEACFFSHPLIDEV